MIPAANASPSITLFVNGDVLEGLLHLEVATTNCFSADTFSVTIALGPPPLTGLSFWASASNLTVQINAMTSGNLLGQTLIIGVVDSITVDPLQATVSIEGRDLSARLIDSYWQQDFVNQTAAEVVTIIASQHRLLAAVAPTQGMVGRYYSDGFTRLSLGQFSRVRTNWDLLVELARENQFDIFVSGETLYFQPSTATTVTERQITLADVVRMRIERITFVAPTIAVRVQSWNSQDMAPYFNPNAVSADGAQSFLFSGANLTPSQVDATASRLNAELHRLCTILHLEMPWDLDMVPRSQLLVIGTSSAIDTVYTIDSIERNYSFALGATQRVRAVLLQPDYVGSSN